MGAIGFQYKMDGAERLQRAYRNAAKAAQYPHDLLVDIAEHLLTSTKKNFDTRGDGLWAPVKRKTPWAPLRSQRDRLYKAATQRNAEGNLFVIGRNYVTVGVDPKVIKYARAHQKGYRKRNLPARPYAYVRKTDASVIARKAGFWMQSTLKAGLIR